MEASPGLARDTSPRFCSTCRARSDNTFLPERQPISCLWMPFGMKTFRLKTHFTVAVFKLPYKTKGFVVGVLHASLSQCRAHTCAPPPHFLPPCTPALTARSRHRWQAQFPSEAPGPQSSASCVRAEWGKGLAVPGRAARASRGRASRGRASGGPRRRGQREERGVAGPLRSPQMAVGPAPRCAPTPVPSARTRPGRARSRGSSPGRRGERRATY